VSRTILTWDGLDDLKAALRSLPQDLTDDAVDIVNAAVQSAEQEIAAGYHVGKTGNLRRGLSTTMKPGLFKTVAVLKNTAAHAWLWDHGSQLRHYTTRRAKARKDVGAMWGQTAPPFTFIRGVIKWRAIMYDQLAAMLAEHGLTVRRA